MTFAANPAEAIQISVSKQLQHSLKHSALKIGHKELDLVNYLGLDRTPNDQNLIK